MKYLPLYESFLNQPSKEELRNIFSDFITENGFTIQDFRVIDTSNLLHVKHKGSITFKWIGKANFYDVTLPRMSNDQFAVIIELNQWERNTFKIGLGRGDIIDEIYDRIEEYGYELAFSNVLPVNKELTEIVFWFQKIEKI